MIAFRSNSFCPLSRDRIFPRGGKFRWVLPEDEEGMLAYPRVLGKNPPKFCRRQNAARQSVSSIAFQQVLRKGSGKPSPKEGFPESLVSPVSLHKGILCGRIISSPTNHLFKFFEGRGELSSKKVPHIFRISRSSPVPSRNLIRRDENRAEYHLTYRRECAIIK